MRDRIKKLAPGALVLALVLLATIPGGGSLSAQGRAVPNPSELLGGPPTATFSLDGVTLELTTSFLSDPSVATSAPASAIQVATAVGRGSLFRQLSITVAPFGATPPTESLPPAGPDREESYRTALRAYREKQGARPRDGAVMRLFGEDVIGSTSVISLPLRAGDPVPVAITEWVVGAGRRVWIVRASRELAGRSISQPPATSEALLFSDLALSSSDLRAPSSSLAPMELEGPLSSDVADVTVGPSDLPFPAWWIGECDTVSFWAATGVAAYPLGAEYRGMKACGPRPSAYPYVQAAVDFGVGHPQLEWQCPELSKRFLYLAYGIPPYAANGNQMVWNYDGDLLEKVWNCTVGRAPEPDDVLSHGSTSTYGHTTVVVSSDVDSVGNGTIDVIEQNNSAHGYNTLTVDNWCVVPSYGDVIGWLHNPGWFVTYYNDGSLTDRCGGDGRAGMYLFEAWRNGAPGPDCPSDRVSARFSRIVDFSGGEYTFALGYDEQARLKVDGETVVDGWGAADQHYATHYLEAGHHRVSVEYYDRVGEASLTAFWWGPGFALARQTQDSSQWYAEYWGNPALWWDPVVKIREGGGPLDHHWLESAPAENLPADRFSSRFRRTLTLEAGRWRFDVFADDGVRFWIDGQLIVDEWQDQVAEFNPTVTLDSGAHALTLEHYENLGHGKIGVDWEYASEAVTPTGWVTSPPDGTVIDACPIILEAQVGGDVGPVERVEFYALYDGQLHQVGSDDASPYNCVWNCLSVDNQTAWLTVHVWDGMGMEYVDLGHQVGVHLNHLRYVHLPLIVRVGPGGS